ncbi:hypothetical protein PGTUg99_009474 [Puccinia graminis f. sp. tritici]|uniref:Uncharacterized protein n=1 Tax=Puccinia graminis f. sp. tritici TaxID=56615 RepID=A0A5B0NH75_PUCGR|nr:hypothetical protein PGTUg99_009474 [Puccinia graminis f. sp. tritici]
MNFSMTCIDLPRLSPRYRFGGPGGPGKSALTKGGAAGAEASGDGGSKPTVDPATKAEHRKTAAMVLETVSKGLGAGELSLSSKITQAVGSGLKAAS